MAAFEVEVLDVPEHEPVLAAGAASVDITPDEPVVMSGYGSRTGRSTGTHDRLYATALVLDDGIQRIGLVGVDLLNVSVELSRRVRDAVDGLDELMIAASHTHAGPYMPARALDVSPALNTDVDVSAAVEPIEAGIVTAVTDAAASLAPARIGTATETVEDVAINRRAAGGVSGNVRVPFGRVDPTVTTIKIKTDDTVTILYHFACHPVCTRPSETLLSADWPGVTRRLIQSEHPNAHVIYLNGAAGDINPAPAGDDDPYEHMERIGGPIGEGVLAAIEDCPLEPSQETMHVDRSTVRFPVRRTPRSERAREIVAELEAELDSLEKADDRRGIQAVRNRLQEAREVAAIAEWSTSTLPSRVTGLQLGEIALVGMPGEVHLEHGHRFQEAAAVDTLLPVGYVDDYVGYIPTLDDLQHVGYEVRTMKIAPEGIFRFQRAVRDLVEFE